MDHLPLDDDDDSDTNNDIPRGVIRKRKGWEGEEMELLRDNKPSSKTSAAVDLNQFRNTEVGKGYQAKHVVRQRVGMGQASMENVKRVASSSDKKTSKKRKSASGEDRLAKYLKCSGVREFRRQLEEILKSS